VSTPVDSAAYVYCVVGAKQRPRMTRAPGGVPGATAPEAHDIGAGLWLIASPVPLAVYGPTNLDPRLRDLDWVAEVAVGHEAVNEFLAGATSAVVVPMKLFTMFSSVDKAIGDVRARRRTIDRAMRHVAGCEEWGIRVTLRPLVMPTLSDDPQPPTGAAFLRARKAMRDAAADARSGAIAAADAAFARLKRHARDAHVRERRAEPGSNPPILEAAFLVRVSARARFKAEARRQAPILARAGVDLTVTGPWPAYHFVGREA